MPDAESEADAELDADADGGRMENGGDVDNEKMLESVPLADTLTGTEVPLPLAEPVTEADAETDESVLLTPEGAEVS